MSRSWRSCSRTVVAAPLLLATVASSPAHADAAATTTLTLTAREFRFTPGEVHIPAGTAATLRLQNTGVLSHNLVLVLPDADGVRSRTIQPGEQARIDLGALPPGRYAFYCAVPGHREAGMKGTLVVEPPSGASSER